MSEAAPFTFEAASVVPLTSGATGRSGAVHRKSGRAGGAP